MRKRKRVSVPDDKVLDLTCFELSEPICVDPASTATAIAAGVSALASAGSGIAMVSKKRGTTRMLNVAKDLAQYNNELARSNWRLENEYNSPAAQMQRYKEAGLNPNLIYGQQNTAGSIQSGSVSTNPEDYTGGAGRYAEGLSKIAGAAAVYQDIVAKKASIDNTDASTQGLKTKAALEAAMAEGQVIQNKYQDEMMSHQLEGLTLANAQKALDLELDRQFKARERIWKLEESKSRVSDLDASASVKHAEERKINEQILQIRQDIAESRTRQYSLVKGIELGYGNLNVARMNAATNRMNANTAYDSMMFGQFNQNRLFNFEKEKFNFNVKNSIMEQVLKYSQPSGMIGDVYRFGLNAGQGADRFMRGVANAYGYDFNKK